MDKNSYIENKKPCNIVTKMQSPSKKGAGFAKILRLCQDSEATLKLHKSTNKHSNYMKHTVPANPNYRSKLKKKT